MTHPTNLPHLQRQFWAICNRLRRYTRRSTSFLCENIGENIDEALMFAGQHWEESKPRTTCRRPGYIRLTHVHHLALYNGSRTSADPSRCMDQPFADCHMWSWRRPQKVWSLMDALHPTIKRFQDVNKTMLQSTSIKFNIKFSTKQWNHLGQWSSLS